jgi:aspartyl protease
MKVRYGIVAGLLLTFTIGSITILGLDLSSKRFSLNGEGGSIEVHATHPGDKQTRDAVRQQLQDQVRKVIPSATPAMLQHRKDIKYKFEKTEQGGRIRITAKTREALLAVQDYLRSQINGSSYSPVVAFDFIANTSLVVLPVSINNQGPFRFLLDTGASNTVLSAGIADGLGIPVGRNYILLSAAGNVPVNLRLLNMVQVGAVRLEGIEVAVANFDLMKTLNVDGILGGDYLRRFKISIDYAHQIVDIEPLTPETMSMNVA